ncbi:MAG: OmpA family protein [Cyanobacteria bacterium SBLK]|nr:OmpA family protein [Cyanobacteria bacterium SBLK]
MTFKQNSTSENSNGNGASQSRGSTDPSQRTRSWDDLLDFWAEPEDEDFGQSNPPREPDPLERQTQNDRPEAPALENSSPAPANADSAGLTFDDLEQLLGQNPTSPPSFDRFSEGEDANAPSISNWTQKISKFQPSPLDSSEPSSLSEPSLSDNEWPMPTDAENTPALFEGLIEPVGLAPDLSENEITENEITENETTENETTENERLAEIPSAPSPSAKERVENPKESSPIPSTPPASQPIPPIAPTGSVLPTQRERPAPVQSSTLSETQTDNLSPQPDSVATPPLAEDLAASPPLAVENTDPIPLGSSQKQSSQPPEAEHKTPPPPPRSKPKAKSDRPRQNGAGDRQTKRKSTSSRSYGLFKPRAEELDDPLKDLRDFLLADSPKLEPPPVQEEEEDLDIPNLITFENSLKRLHELEQAAPAPTKSPAKPPIKPPQSKSQTPPPSPTSNPQPPTPKPQPSNLNPQPPTSKPPTLNPQPPTSKPPTLKPPTSNLKSELGPMLGELETVAKSLSDEDVTRLHGTIEELEDKLAALENQVYEPTEVINPLVPLMVQLLKMKVGVSQDAVMDVVVPIIDEVIQRRTQQNPSAMSEAISELIPDAIAREIQKSPQEVAKAIGPEMGAAIREQIRVERDAISEALGPEMGRAIKQQIEVERDAMVDALYPVIGSTVSKYMGDVVSAINDKVEKTLSPEGITRKIRAKLQGVSEAELILQESVPVTVQAIFLIHKASGLVISEIQPAFEHRLEANMLAGMLTAIQSFVNDCIAQSGEIAELNEIEYGDSRIILEVAGYCYLAVAIKGEHPKPFIKQMRQTLGQIVQKYDREIEEFEGDSDTIPAAIPELLEKLIPKPSSEQKKSPTALLSLLAAMILLVILPWGYFQVKGYFNRRLEAKINAALVDLEASSYTELSSKVRGKKVSLTGRVPLIEMKDNAAKMVQGIDPRLEVNNQIAVVQVPPDPAWVATSIELVTSLLNRDRDIDITAAYSPGKVILRGGVSRLEDYSMIINAFQKLPGINTVDRAQLLPEVLQKRLYFEEASSRLTSREISNTLVPIQRFLNEHPELRLKIIGHADPTGQSEDNRVLSTERAMVVRRELERRGIAAERLENIGIPEAPPDVAAEQPLKWSRCVRFELAFSDE